MSVQTAFSPARVVKVAEGLPSAPKVLAELTTLLQNPNNGLEDVSTLLRMDAGLTVRVMRIANGIIYNKGDSATSLEEALARVGFNEVFRLLGTASLAQLMSFQLRFYQIGAERLRENALFTALLMEELAPLAGINPRTAYTAGLLRSAGKIALDATAQIDLRFQRPTPIPADRPVQEWETDTFGLTSSASAEAVLRAWRFPYEIYVPIRDHYLHGLAVDAHPSAELLHLAAYVTETRGLSLPGEAFYWDANAARVRAKLQLTELELESFAQRAQVRFDRMKAAFA